MTFVACGINHKTAPIDVRERFSLLPETQHALLLDFVQQPHVHGAMMLSTCNRTEIYCDTEKASHVLPWLMERQALPQKTFEEYAYIYQADQGVRHTMRVACGLDSMVLGEPQILGQMKQAYHDAQQIGTLNVSLHHVFRHIFNASKKVRAQTNIGAYPVSVAFTAVHLIRQAVEDLTKARVLLIGSGDTVTLVAKYLKDQGVTQFQVAGRTLENTQKLADALSAPSLSIHDMPTAVPDADIIISATSCPFPFIGKEMIAQNLRNKPLFILDLAVPRDVEADVATLHNVFLYNVDDLQRIAREGLEERQHAALSAEQMIEREVNNYLLQERGKKARHVIHQYREYAKKIKADELLRAKQQLMNNHNPDNIEKILEEMGHRLTRKLLHRPSLKLRKAAFEERHDLLEYTTYLYDDKS